MRNSIAHGLEAHMMSERLAKKRAVDLFVDAELLDEARRLRINISDTLERRLRSIVRAEQGKRWLEENQEAIASINSFIDRRGLLASKLRYRPAQRGVSC
jgi:antitoxin CcdA